MRWEFLRRSNNVEDRRGIAISRPVVGGGIGVAILAIVVTLLGGDPSLILQHSSPRSPSSYSSTQANRSPTDIKMTDFVSAVLADIEDTWKQIFRQMGRTYVDPKLVLFSSEVESACGFARAAMGPFYCPRDQKVYIDLSFYRELKYRYKAPGDFAEAYVIAHEVGHHVQNLLGVSRKVQSMQSQVSRVQANQLSVRQELQADCFAGIWANRAHKRQLLEAGDIEEALKAASSIGDDRLQKEAKGYVIPESFTHGSSAQRVYWFKRGIQTGSLGQCNTFETAKL
ncbi:MAG: neutral zinc metallopeptidase [Chroococcidiopsidaceae cyanobacterium CP_BM_ER_R8_30]|nr:neutral zinc metallopeptidase [Chroococcidiopsidaceae cyanobacterium CP_BM_ER_R8_30]